MKIQHGSFIKITLLIISFSLAIYTFSFAEDQSQEVPPYRAFEAIEQMMPTMMAIMITTMLELFSDPATAEKEATHARNLYEALLKKGFSEKEAIAIVIGYGNPATLGSKQ